MAYRDWHECRTEAAPHDAVVETKIDDENGVRNVTTLRRRGRLWFFPDNSMYVYYSPTHWRLPHSNPGSP